MALPVVVKFRHMRKRKFNKIHANSALRQFLQERGTALGLGGAFDAYLLALRAQLTAQQMREMKLPAPLPTAVAGDAWLINLNDVIFAGGEQCNISSAWSGSWAPMLITALVSDADGTFARIEKVTAQGRKPYDQPAVVAMFYVTSATTVALQQTFATFVQDGAEGMYRCTTPGLFDRMKAVIANVPKSTANYPFIDTKGHAMPEDPNFALTSTPVTDNYATLTGAAFSEGAAHFEGISFGEAGALEIVAKTPFADQFLTLKVEVDSVQYTFTKTAGVWRATSVPLTTLLTSGPKAVIIHITV